MNLPFIKIDFGEDDFYARPYIPACFVRTKDVFDEFLAKHEKENSKKQFPFCCSMHQFIHDDVKAGLDILISEKRYFDKWWFKIENYQDLPLKVATQIILTQYHIDNKFDNPEGAQDIIEYIEYIIESFGQPRIFAEYYLCYLKQILEQSEVNEKEKEVYKALLEHIEDTYYKPQEKVEFPDLNELYATYQKWIEHFPFDIVYFKDLKEKFKKQLPFFLQSAPINNRYTGIAKGKIHDKAGLIGILVNTTKELLKQVNAIELVKQSVIPDTKQHTIELLNETLRIKNENLLGEFNNGETKYLGILEKWLTNQKEYFIEITQLTTLQNETLETKADRLNAEISKYGFYDLPKVEKLNESKKTQLTDLLSSNDVPFQIAMFSYLGYFDYLIKNYTQSKFKLNKLLAEILGCDERTIKGNIAVLQTYSKEDRKRYTAHKQTKNVQKAYQALI